MEHTQGTWENFNHYVWTEDRQSIANCKNVQDGNPITPEESYANAKRICQCVNACAGMENPEEDIKELKEWAETGKELGC
jgi:hypothetical protein